MSSYWDAALRAGRGLHGTAEPRPHSRFEDDEAAVDAFQPVEIEQEVRAPVADKAIVDRSRAQEAGQPDQTADNLFADEPVAEPLVRTRADDQQDMAVPVQGNETRSATADSQPDVQRGQRATLVPAAEPALSQSIAAVPVTQASKAEANALPIVQIYEQITTAETEFGSPPAPSEPNPPPVFFAPEPQDAEPQPIIVAAEPVAKEAARPDEEQPHQPPALLITIDSIDIRIGAESNAPQHATRRVQPPVVALQDYLARRSRGNE